MGTSSAAGYSSSSCAAAGTGISSSSSAPRQAADIADARLGRRGNDFLRLIVKIIFRDLLNHGDMRAVDLVGAKARKAVTSRFIISSSFSLSAICDL